MPTLSILDEPLEPNQSGSHGLRLAYYLSAAHLLACITSMIGLVIPSLQFLGIIQMFILLADLPISAPVYVLAWKYSLIAQLWVVILGTLWWYFLGRLARRIFC